MIGIGQMVVDLIAASADLFRVDVEKTGGIIGGTLTFPSAAQGANRLRLRADQVGNLSGTDFYGHFWAMSGKP